MKTDYVAMLCFVFKQKKATPFHYYSGPGLGFWDKMSRGFVRFKHLEFQSYSKRTGVMIQEMSLMFHLLLETLLSLGELSFK